MREFSTAAAARYLQASEATVRKWADKGELPHYRAPSGHRRFQEADLEALAVRRGLGVTARAQRTIILIGKGLTEQIASIEAAGLHCSSADAVLDGIRSVQQRGVPIIVMSVKAAQEERTLLKYLLRDGTIMVCIIASSVFDVPHELEPFAVVRDRNELRSMVEWVWGAVKKRHDSVTLGL